MSVEAFLRQGFVPYDVALAEQFQALSSAAPVLRERALAAARGIGDPTELTFVGIGASLAALATPVAYLAGNGIPSTRVNAAEFAGTSLPGTVVALSQSGRSRETVDVLRAATGHRVAVVNVSDSPLADAADAVLSLGDQHDSLASSIGFTASSMGISMLCEAWIDGSPSTNWDSLGRRLSEYITAVEDVIDAVVAEVLASTAIDFVAPADLFGIAEGGSLLLREVSRVAAAPFETRQYLHGLMEATNRSMLHLVVDGTDDGQILDKLGSLDRRTVRFGSRAGADRSAATIDVPTGARSDLEAPVFAAVFLQQVAGRAARARGIDPDVFLFLDTGTKLEDDE